MKLWFAILILLGGVYPQVGRGAPSDTPDQIMEQTLGSVLQIAKNTVDSLQSGVYVFPGIQNGGITNMQHSKISALWRKTWQDSGYTVFLQSNPTSWEVLFDLEEYQFRVHKPHRRIFTGEQTSTGTLTLSGAISVAVPGGRVIATIPIEKTREFDIDKHAKIWDLAQTQMAFPVEFAASDQPEIRTILLSLTSAVIIYLFYTIRG